MTDRTQSLAADRRGERSHVIMVSQPEAVTNVILEAVAAVAAVPVGA